MGKRWFYASTIKANDRAYTVQYSHKQAVRFQGLLFAHFPHLPVQYRQPQSGCQASQSKLPKEFWSNLLSHFKNGMIWSDKRKKNQADI
jgi:hypothetical protein